jgi:hypothetical protein
MLAVVLVVRTSTAPEPAVAPTSTPPPATRPAIGAAPGQVVPAGQPPPATATPRAVFYRGEPFGPAKVEPGSTYAVQLGRLEQGTEVRAVISVAFNNRLANLGGSPDITIRLTGPCQARGEWPRARNGAQIAFQAAATGECAIVLDNTYSRINAKQVSIAFLQP